MYKYCSEASCCPKKKRMRYRQKINKVNQYKIWKYENKLI